ncbi:MAG: hypothetical protein HY698_20195 [Deltaproteobacteria bacterium]|nr:hypothetical protein [Deltaproteobacteria bacterium]
MSDSLGDWPLPPHDPRERVVIAETHGWEVRMFATDDIKHVYFSPRGLLHLQLWHAGHRLSVLTPSRLTLGHFEAYPVRGWKYRPPDYETLKRELKVELKVGLPPQAEVKALQRWFVHRYEVEAERKGERTAEGG